MTIASRKSDKQSVEVCVCVLMDSPGLKVTGAEMSIIMCAVIKPEDVASNTGSLELYEFIIALVEAANNKGLILDLWAHFENERLQIQRDERLK